MQYFTNQTIEQLSEQTSHFIINQEFIDPNGFNAPLNRDQIQELSRELGRELPSHYQEYLLNFPQEIANFTKEFLNARISYTISVILLNHNWR